MFQPNSVVPSPCCNTHQGKIIIFLPVIEAYWKLSLVECQNPECPTILAGIFKGWSCVPTEELNNLEKNQPVIVADNILLDLLENALLENKILPCFNQRPSKHALIIEDWPAAALILSYHLEFLNYTTAVHAWGTDAIDKVLEAKPDVIFLDLHLPDMMGWDVLKALKENKSTKHIPVIITSVDYFPEQAQELGAYGILEKPINLDNLRNMLCTKRVAKKETQLADTTLKAS